MTFNPDHVAGKRLPPSEKTFVPTMKPVGEQLRSQKTESLPAPLTKADIKEKLPELVRLNPGMSSAAILELLKKHPGGVDVMVSISSIGGMCMSMRKKGILRGELADDQMKRWYWNGNGSKPDDTQIPKSDPASNLLSDDELKDTPVKLVRELDAENRARWRELRIEQNTSSAEDDNGAAPERATAKAGDGGRTPHYTQHPSGVEAIEITEHFNFCIGNALKYLWRAGLKPGADAITDLEKARWYVEREIQRRRK